MSEIIPSPGTNNENWQDISQKVEKVKSVARTLHIDIVDSAFSDKPTSLDPTPFSAYKDTFFLEVHLMVENPHQYLTSFANAGFKRFIGHVEKMENQVEFVAAGQILGEVGLYLDGPTPVEAITVPLEDLDCLGIFTARKVGLSGQSFEKEKLEKVRSVRKQNILNNKGLPLPIEVDGGINTQTLPLAKEAGATRFVCTSALFQADSVEEMFKQLQALS